MKTTRASLLIRLRDPRDREAWSEFFAIYAPLLYRFARSRGLSSSDADEIRDQSLAILASQLPDFDYDTQRGKFKSWLYRIVHARIVDLHRLRKHAHLSDQELDDLPTADPRSTWDAEWRAEHLRFAFERARSRVSSLTWEIFESLMDERSVPEICSALAVNRNQVYKARGRVLTAVRDILTQLDPDEFAIRP